MLKLRCLINLKLRSLNLHVGSYTAIANYARPLIEVNYVFTAEVIPYQEQWKRVTTIESYRIVTGLLSLLADSGILQGTILKYL